MLHEFGYEPIGEKLYPIIPLLVGFGNDWVPINALVDSGANLCIFNADVGRALGIEIEKGEKLILSGIAGKITSFVHKIKLNIEGEEMEVEAAFTDELAVSINLLGRKDLFERFSITFDDLQNS